MLAKEKSNITKKLAILYVVDFKIQRHTAGSDTIFIEIYMTAVPGVSKNQIFLTNKIVYFLR